MPIWIPLSIGVVTLVAAVTFGLIADKSRRGTLPRNSMVGIRLPSTLQSDEAWEKAHRKTWAANALIALIFLIGASLMLFGANGMAESRLVMIAGLMVGAVTVVLIAQVMLVHKVLR